MGDSVCSPEVVGQFNKEEWICVGYRKPPRYDPPNNFESFDANSFTCHQDVYWTKEWKYFIEYVWDFIRPGIVKASEMGESYKICFDANFVLSAFGLTETTSQYGNIRQLAPEMKIVLKKNTLNGASSEARLQRAKQFVETLCDILVKKGWVIKVMDPNDPRKKDANPSEFKKHWKKSKIPFFTAICGCRIQTTATPTTNNTKQ